MNQEEEFEAGEWASDDVTGQWLGGGKVAAARMRSDALMKKASARETVLSMSPKRSA